MAGATAWRSMASGADPQSWPANASFETQRRLAVRYLRRQGWTMGEPMPWMNVFVRGDRGNVWLNLMIHGPETLSLPLLMRDCIDKTANTPVLVGILTRSALPDDLKADAERSGLYVISPAELADVEVHINRAAARVRERREAAAAPDRTMAGAPAGAA